MKSMESMDIVLKSFRSPPSLGWLYGGVYFVPARSKELDPKNWTHADPMGTHGIHGTPWGPMGTHGNPWEPMGTHGDP